MATEGEALRGDDAGGKSFLTSQRASDNKHIQPAFLTDNEGDPVGVPGAPFRVAQDGTVTISGSVTRPEDSLTHDDPNTTLVDQRTIKGSAATVYSIVVNNTDTQGLYAQIWDHASAAGSGTLRWSFYVPASHSLAYDFKSPVVCSAGFTVAVSTVTTGFTAPGTTAAQFSADYS